VENTQIRHYFPDDKEVEHFGNQMNYRNNNVAKEVMDKIKNKEKENETKPEKKGHEEHT
jgi:hypothetical protein